MDITRMSEPGLLKLHFAVCEALKTDDQLVLSGKETLYGVRKYSDWREWADWLEAELDRREVEYKKIPW